MLVQCPVNSNYGYGEDVLILECVLHLGQILFVCLHLVRLSRCPADDEAISLRNLRSPREITDAVNWHYSINAD